MHVEGKRIDEVQELYYLDSIINSKECHFALFVVRKLLKYDSLQISPTK